MAKRPYGISESFGEDDELLDEIRSRLSDEVERIANLRAAEGWSSPDSVDVRDEGYDDESAVAIASFGSEVAVNTEALIDPDWKRRLGIPSTGEPQLWSEVGTTALYQWLRKHGYELLDLGGEVPVVEEEVDLRHAVSRVARELNVPTETVWRVARSLCDRDFSCSYDQTLAYVSVTGDVEIWARPLED